MVKSRLQGSRARILLTVLTIAVMVMIFCFSTEPAEKSDETSGVLARQVIGMLYPEYEFYPETQRLELYDNIQTAVRKGAHFTEFAALGLLLRLEYLREFATALNFDLALGADVLEYDARAREILNGGFFPDHPEIHGAL